MKDRMNEMNLIRLERLEDFQESVVTRPLHGELDRTLVRELVQKLNLLCSK